MQVGLKPHGSRGEYLVDLLADGNSRQFLGTDPDGVWMFRGDFKDALARYQGLLAAAEPQWNSHVSAALYDRPCPPFDFA
jgi:hypothetical protein